MHLAIPKKRKRKKKKKIIYIYKVLVATVVIWEG